MFVSPVDNVGYKWAIVNHIQSVLCLFRL